MCLWWKWNEDDIKRITEVPQSLKEIRSITSTTGIMGFIGVITGLVRDGCTTNRKPPIPSVPTKSITIPWIEKTINLNNKKTQPIFYNFYNHVMRYRNFKEFSNVLHYGDSYNYKTTSNNSVESLPTETTRFPTTRFTYANKMNKTVMVERTIQGRRGGLTHVGQPERGKWQNSQ